MDVLVKGKDFAQRLFNQVIGLQSTRLKMERPAIMRYGTFISLDFGEDISRKLKGKRTIGQFGEWHFRMDICSWRIDKEGVPLVASYDSREKIRANLSVLKSRKVTEIQVLNNAFDLKFQFGDDVVLTVFSINARDERWELYTPENKVFFAGPGAAWKYVEEERAEVDS